MNEIEVSKLPKDIESFLSEFKSSTAITWNQQEGKYEIDKRPEAIEKREKKLAEFKGAIRDIYTFGEGIYRGTPKFCLALKRIWDDLDYIEDSSEIPRLRYGLTLMPSLCNKGVNEGFARIIEKLGISSTSAYRYKDLSIFVDPETADFYSEFQGYSISLLSEMYSCACGVYASSLPTLKDLAKLVPSDTTIENMRLYGKVLKMLRGYSRDLSVFANWKYSERYELSKKPLPEVLKVYNELVQKVETKKLEATMSGVEQTAKNDKSAKVLPGADEMIVKREEYRKINELAERASKIGACDGCKYKETNLNKCRCCRRYESLKDLFEAN